VKRLEDFMKDTQTYIILFPDTPTHTEAYLLTPNIFKDMAVLTSISIKAVDTGINIYPDGMARVGSTAVVCDCQYDILLSFH
jgi:hypothetical protein